MQTVPFEALQANNFLWASVLIPDLLDQQEKFTTSAICVTKLTIAAKADFICKILCFEVYKILFGQLVDRVLENKSLHECEIPPPPCQESAPLVHIFGLTSQEWYLTC